jgi:glycosyltransferase involved in cell wall biosynthesis
MIPVGRPDNLTGVPAGLNVVGYLDALIGQGESARLFCGGLEAAGVPWAGYALRLPATGGRARTTSLYGAGPLAHRATVLWCNPDRYGIDVTVDRVLTGGGYTIGRWAWEVDVVPEGWRAAGRRLDEIWVISEFVAGALRGAVDAPVTVLPLPVAAPPGVSPMDRSRLGMAEEAFMFLFTFDYHSTVARKNPEAVIAAYRRAFTETAGTALLIKSVNAASCPREAEALQRAAAGRADIRILDTALPGEEKNALIATCDCYVSLHRAEGFGIAMAEAMALGRPVIATGYSGNREFMGGPDALFVGHRLVPVGAGVEPYPAEAMWAEPDVAHAAALMRRLAADPAGAAERGRRGAARLAERFAPAVAGAVAARHIQRAHATLALRHGGPAAAA